MGTTEVDQTRQTQITTRRKEMLIHTQVSAAPEQEIIRWNHKIMALEDPSKLALGGVVTTTTIQDAKYMCQSVEF